ncbi:transposase [Dyella sp. M7H15-1]|nr:transposase [Dyella sp. M7H15-1]
MSEGKKRKTHSAEFKAKVDLEAVRGVKTINEIAQQYGVHPVMVSQWKKEIMDRAGSLFETKRGPKPNEASGDDDRLYSEIGRLKVELDWLKKSPVCEHGDADELDRCDGHGAVYHAAVRIERGATGKCV